MTSRPHFAVSRAGFVLFVAVCVSLCGCRRGSKQADSTAHVAIQFDPSPPAAVATTLTVTVTDATGQPLRIADLAVEGDMNHAGMKPVFAQLKETAPGHYSGRIDFTMGGDWVLTFSGDQASGGRFEKRIDVPGVKAQ